MLVELIEVLGTCRLQNKPSSEQTTPKTDYLERKQVIAPQPSIKLCSLPITHNSKAFSLLKKGTYRGEGEGRRRGTKKREKAHQDWPGRFLFNAVVKG
jgi:hypothetical protein